jgi:WD40 repeat protein
VWAVSTAGKPKFTFHEQVPVNSVAFSPDGSRVVIGSDHHVVKIVSPAGRAVRPVSVGRARVTTVAFSPDGRRVAADSQGDVFVWNVYGRHSRVKLASKLAPEGRFSWSPDGRFLATGSAMCDPTTGEVAVRVPRPAQRYLSTAVSRDAKLVAVGPAFGVLDVGIWDTGTGQLHQHFTPLPPNNPSCLAFLPGGDQVLVGTIKNTGQPLAPGGCLAVWDVPTKSLARVLHTTRYGVLSVTVSADGRRIAAAFGQFQSTTPDENPSEVRVWDATTFEEIATFHGHKDCVWSVSFSPDGKRLASASGNHARGGPGEVKVWDITTGQEVWHAAAPKTVYGVAFSPDGRRLATAVGDGTVQIYDGTPLAERPDFRPLPDSG